MLDGTNTRDMLVKNAFNPMNITLDNITHEIIEKFFFLSNDALSTKIASKQKGFRNKPLRYVLEQSCRKIGGERMPPNFGIYTTTEYAIEKALLKREGFSFYNFSWRVFTTHRIDCNFDFIVH